MAIKRHYGPNSDLLSLNYSYTSRTVMRLRKSGHLGAVLCRAYENGLGDHMAINGHDGPNSDLLSLNYILTSPNSYLFRVVWSLTQAVAALCYVETMKSVLVIIWPSRDMMVKIVIFFL